MQHDMKVVDTTIRLNPGERCRWALALDHLSNTEVALVNTKVRSRKYGAGETVFIEGHPAEELVIVSQGQIKCYMLSPSGNTFTPAIYGPDRLTGLLSALLEAPRMVTAATTRPSVLSSIHITDLHYLMGKIPMFSANMAKLAAAMASDLIWVLGQRAMMPASVRLCYALIALGQQRPLADWPNALVVQGLSQEDLAGFIGASRTWVSHTLGELEQAGFIWRDRKEIGVYEPDRLGHEADSTLMGL